MTDGTETGDIREMRAELRAVEQRLRETIRSEIHDLEQRLTQRIVDLERALTQRIDRHMAQLASLERWQSEIVGAGHAGKVVWFALVAAGATIYHLATILVSFLREHRP